MSNNDGKRLKTILLKLWNETQFSIWSQSAKSQANSLYQILTKYMEDFRDFKCKMDSSYDFILMKNHALPAFQVISEELRSCKYRVDKLLQQQAQITGKIIQLLASFRKSLQFGEIKATKQYTQTVAETLNSHQFKLSQRKILQIHHQYVNLDIQQKLIVKNSAIVHPFEKWYVDFSIRSEQFFRSMFSNLNTKDTQFQPYNPQINHPQSSKTNTKQQSQKISSNSLRYSQIQQSDEDDIVKQIFKQIHG